MNLKESIRHILKEETLKNILIDMVKNEGIKSVENYVGGFQNLKDLIDVHTSEEFLNLFSDLERVESEENPDIFLYRYKKGKNVIVVDERDDDMRNVYVYVNYDLIYGPLAIFKESVFYKDKSQILKKWMKNTFDIEATYMQVDSFQPGSEDYGFWELLN
jgi:hypothetical protein